MEDWAAVDSQLAVVVAYVGGGVTVGGVWLLARVWSERWGRHGYIGGEELSRRLEPYTRQARVLLGADAEGDLDVVAGKAALWLKDQEADGRQGPNRPDA